MTWDVSELGEPLIMSAINGSDLVPSFSATFVDDLRAKICLSFYYCILDMGEILMVFLIVGLSINALSGHSITMGK